MGIYGVAFEPYVGSVGWRCAGSLQRLYPGPGNPIAQARSPQHYGLITTYGQGTFVWQGKPNVQDANRLNIEAAAKVGLKVSAGCYQQGADPQTDSINLEWTKTEIDYAVRQAKTHGNVVELVVGNECLWGPNSSAGNHRPDRLRQTAALTPDRSEPAHHHASEMGGARRGRQYQPELHAHAAKTARR